MLKVNDINVYYGAIHAIKGLSFEVNQGEIVTLIGSNGAGKTTTLQTVSGMLKPKTGSIILQDQDISSMQAHNLVELGMAHVPEGRRVFAQMNVQENLEMGAYTVKGHQHIKDDFAMVYDMFPRLKERRKQLAGTMSGGEQQMLAIGRALMSKPKIILLDEPSMGLAPILVGQVFETIKEINSKGMTVLLVEQNAHDALKIADRAYVLETGKIVMSGAADELLDHDAVKKAYLG